MSVDTQPAEELRAALKSLWQKGAKAWKDVPSASAWVEELRGNTLPPPERHELSGPVSERPESD